MRFLVNKRLYRVAWNALKRPEMRVVPPPTEWSVIGNNIYDQRVDRVVDHDGNVVVDLDEFYMSCSKTVGFVPSRVQFLSTDLLDGGFASREFTSIYILGENAKAVEDCWAIELNKRLHRVESVQPVHPGTTDVYRVDYNAF